MGDKFTPNADSSFRVVDGFFNLIRRYVVLLHELKHLLVVQAFGTGLKRKKEVENVINKSWGNRALDHINALVYESP